MSEKLSTQNDRRPADMDSDKSGISLHDQLYLYAEDLRQLLERNVELESAYLSLHESSSLLLQNREQLLALMANSRDIHIWTDTEGRILQANPAAAKLADANKLQSSVMADWVELSHHTNYYKLLEHTVKKMTVPEEEWELLLHSGNNIQLLVSAQALAVHQEEHIEYLHWVLRDITSLREIKLNPPIMKSPHEGVMITDIDGQILAVNPAFCRITGYSSDEIIGQTPRIFKSGKQDAAFYKEFWNALRNKGFWNGEIYNRRKNGSIYPEWLSISAAWNSNGQILAYIAVFSDLPSELGAKHKLAYLAHHDSLTGLPNRLLMQDRIGQALALARRTGVHFTVFFLDLDGFKKINDTVGHHAGDAVLKEIAKRLTGTMREVDTVYRLGGDEFIILAPELIGNTNIGRFCDKIVHVLTQPILIDGKELYVGTSIGAVEYPQHSHDEVALLKHADEAMYQAKAAGGNTHVIYQPHS